MKYIGFIMIMLSILVYAINESAIVALKKMMNKKILEDVEKFKNDELFEDESYKEDINDFLTLIGTSTFVLRSFCLTFFLVGLIFIFI